MTAPTTREWLHAAVDRVSVGSQRLATRSIGRVIRSVAGRVGGWPWWVQVPLAYLALLRGPAVLARIGDRVHERVASGAWTGVLTVTTVLWIVAAYRAGRGDEDSPEATVDVGPDEEQSELTVEQPPAGPPRPSLADLRSALSRVGTPHAHIAVLAADLGTTPDRVREALDQWQILVEPVRMRGRGSSTGIKGDALPTPGSAPESVVAAGQPGNNDNNNADDGSAGEGLRVVRTDYGSTYFDPTDNHRPYEARKGDG